MLLTGISPLFLLSAASAEPIEVNDPLFHKQWGLHVTDTPQAWKITTGSTGVTVAIIDTGVDYTHPDLYLNIWINQGEIPEDVEPLLCDTDGDALITFWDLNHPSGINVALGQITDLNGSGFIDGGDLLFPVDEGGWGDGEDNESNGFVDDLIGWDFFNDDNNPMDEVGHGSAMAGVVGAIADNDLGTVGMNWKTRMLPVRMSPGALTATDIERVIAVTPEAIRYATDNEARVSNNSYGAPWDIVPPDILEAALLAIDDAAARGHLLVFSAGNDGQDNDLFPRAPHSADLPNILVASATSKSDHLTSFSNWGATTVDLGAPGKTVWTTDVLGDYGHGAGTSFSVPHVVGAAALILSVDPRLEFEEVKSLVLENVEPVADLRGMTVTGGRLDAGAAVAAAVR